MFSGQSCSLHHRVTDSCVTLIFHIPVLCLFNCTLLHVEVFRILVFISFKEKKKGKKPPELFSFFLNDFCSNYRMRSKIIPFNSLAAAGSY